ncbi:3-oxoadipate enol-lactonase [uncultured Cohaesibacter sp.]|uniref:3-oxoadipate enol-lactonase n=1 Tax=uncultured Cohaesibacter sp. TaxID=1002546 RepID=UPI00292E3482|nr:3-oxoadipate enol-lactonase [uncultured Cohaesibacter sp.]
MRIAKLDNVAHHWRDDGDPAGKAVVFANSLGTDLRLWDALLPLLPEGLHYIRYDTRGHGLSSCPPPPYSIEDLIDDAETLLDHLGISEALFVGLSIGGMIAQGLAVRRPDLIKALVLSNTAARMGDAAMWRQRIDWISKNGLEPLSDSIMQRWFSPAFLASDDQEAWRNMLRRTPVAGYLGCCEALAKTDLTDLLPRILQPTLGIAGSLDGASPPEIVQETIEKIPNAHMALIEGTGHLPCVEAPQEFARLLIRFFKETNHA